jgi:hypothetical protein
MNPITLTMKTRLVGQDAAGREWVSFTSIAGDNLCCGCCGNKLPVGQGAGWLMVPGAVQIEPEFKAVGSTAVACASCVIGTVEMPQWLRDLMPSQAELLDSAMRAV